jgi:hypothetical protein
LPTVKSKLKILTRIDIDFYILVPLSCGRGARGEGFIDFHVTPVFIENRYPRVVI